MRFERREPLAITIFAVKPFYVLHACDDGAGLHVPHYDDCIIPRVTCARALGALCMLAMVWACDASRASAQPVAESSDSDRLVVTEQERRAWFAADAPDEEERLPWWHRTLAVGASLVPGLLVHGAGSFIEGDATTGYRLLAMEGAGLVGTVGGLFLVRQTGASRKWVGPLSLLTIAGAALFTTSAVADIYNAATDARYAASPPAKLPWIEAQAGLRYVYDPTFPYRSFAAQGIDLRYRRFRLFPSAWIALNDENTRVRVVGAYRLHGAEALSDHEARDGTAVDLDVAITNHEFGSQGFATTTAEAVIRLRLDMRRVSRSLRGSFAEIEGGFGIVSHRYDDHGSEGQDLLLARFGYGVWIGRGRAPWGEVLAYYDHRRDDFAAGLKVAGIGTGYLGHVGIEAKAYFVENWGVLLDAQLGSAAIAGLSLLYRR